MWVDTFPLGEWEGESYYPPDPDLLHEASRLSTIIGQSWYLGMIDLIATNAEVCASWQLDVMKPLGPDGTFVGWETGFSLEL